MTITARPCSIITFYCLLTVSSITAMELRIPARAILQRDLAEHYAARLTSNPENILSQNEAGRMHYPLCHLSECVGKRCPLSRTRSQKAALARNKFEELVARRLANEQHATYVNLGAGELLPDAIIATRAYQLGLRRLTLHAIDTNYDPLIDPAQHEHLTQFLAYAAGLYGRNNVKLLLYAHVNDYIAAAPITPHAIVGSDFDGGRNRTALLQARTALYNASFHDQCLGATLLAPDCLDIVQKRTAAPISRVRHAQSDTEHNGIACTTYTVDPCTLTFSH